MKASEAPETSGATAIPDASIDPREVALFGGIAAEWWDPKGSSRLLHAINPARLAYIRGRALDHFGRDEMARAPFGGLTALDVGCGGGLLCEPLARMGFAVTGLDAAPENAAVGAAHAAEMGLAIDYRAGSAEALADAMPGGFHLITCLEVIEHVTNTLGYGFGLELVLGLPGPWAHVKNMAC